MRKLWVMALKELKITFRDTGALLMMLATPLALTLIIAFAFGTGSGSPISGIRVLLLDRDESELSQALVNAFHSERLGDLVVPEVVARTPEGEADARERIHEDDAAALVIIPEGFGRRVLLSSDASTAPAEVRLSEIDPAVVEIYAGPQYRISTAVVRAIISQVTEEMNLMAQGIPVAVSHLAADGGDTLDVEVAQRLGRSMTERLVADAEGAAGTMVRLNRVNAGGRAFSWVDYMAASMAILFLMFAVTTGGYSIFAERQAGTLPRLLISPTRAHMILLGKMTGIMLVGKLQVTILWRATSLFGAYWRDPLAVIVSIVLLVMCATGVAALIAAWARTASQAGILGTSVSLIAAAASGAFLPRMNLPVWLQRISLITPNAWGIEIFTALQTGHDLSDILPMLAGVLGLTVVYYVVAAFGFRRQIG